MPYGARRRDPSRRPVELAAGPFLLRPWLPADLPVVLAAYRDPDVRTWSARPVDDAAQAAAWIDGRAAGWRIGRQASFAVTDAATGEVLGNIGLRIDGAAEGGEVGYWTLPGARGRGVASTGLDAVSAWALTSLGLSRIALLHGVLNPASCRVATRCGYRFVEMLAPIDRYPDPGHLHLRQATR
jgi:RimJ/RimL family protein N-acetyltransferase